MIPVYRDRGTFLQGLHPFTQLVLALSLVVVALLTGNPLYLAAVIAATGLLALAAGVLPEWLSWWKLCLIVGLLAIIINPLVSREGATVLWRGPKLPVIGRMDITAEAILFGLGMALKLTAVIWAFALFSLMADPDRMLGLLRGKGSKSALLSAMSMRMVPTAMRDAGEILNAQRARGIARDSGGRISVLRSRIPLVRKLAATSLDRAIGLAEAMESRAYGSGRRTRYRDYAFRSGDVLVTALALSMLGLGIYGAVGGSLGFTYYPTVSWGSGAASLLLVAIPVFASLMLLIISWSWKRWHWLRLRI